MSDDVSVEDVEDQVEENAKIESSVWKDYVKWGRIVVAVLLVFIMCYMFYLYGKYDLCGDWGGTLLKDGTCIWQ